MKPLIQGLERLTPQQIAERERQDRRKAIEAKGAQASLAERVERLEIITGAPIPGQ